MEILACTDADVEAFLDVVEHFLSEFSQHEPAFTPKPGFREGYQQAILRLMENPDYFIDLAKEKGDIIGFLLSGIHTEPQFITSSQGYIADLFVLPEHRRSGCGRMLAEQGVRRMRERGVHYITLNALHRAPGSIDFWKSVGFEEHTARMRLDLCDIEETVQQFLENQNRADQSQSG